MWDFPGDSVGKESACRAGDGDSIPGSESSLGRERGNPFRYSCLENPMDRGAWWATVHRVVRVAHDLRVSMHAHKWYRTVFAFLWLISLNRMLSKSIHVVINGKMSFFFMPEPYSIVYLWPIFFIHLSVDGHLDYFHTVAIVNNAAMNTGIP